MSAGAPFLCRAAGRVWFEVEVLEASDFMVVGFAGTNFRGVEKDRFGMMMIGELGANERGWGIDATGAAKYRRVGGGKTIWYKRLQALAEGSQQQPTPRGHRPPFYPWEGWSGLRPQKGLGAA